MKHVFEQTWSDHVPRSDSRVGADGMPVDWEKRARATCMACGLEAESEVIRMNDPEKPWDPGWDFTDFHGVASRSGLPECPEDAAVTYLVMSA